MLTEAEYEEKNKERCEIEKFVTSYHELKDGTLHDEERASDIKFVKRKMKEKKTQGLKDCEAAMNTKPYRNSEIKRWRKKKSHVSLN